jgi:Tfp pilus assembly protein PilO
MMKRTYIRGFIALLAVTTTGTGVWYMLCKYHVHATETTVSTLQSSILNHQITVVRLRKELTDVTMQSTQVTTVPQSPSEPDLLRELEQAATSSSVALKAASFADSGDSRSANTSKQSTGSSIGVTVQASGTKDALLAFVHTIQANPRFVSITGAQLTNSSDASSADMALQLTFPYGA